MNPHFSRKIISVSFLMSLLVMVIHCDNLMLYGMEQGLTGAAEGIIKLLSFDLGVAAVPVFFLMSGALLFNFDPNTQSRELAGKLRRRLRSTLLPYLVWNIIYTAVYLGGREGIPLLRAGQWGELLLRVLRGVFLGDYCFVFWYLKNLMVLLLLSPGILLLLRRKYLCLAVTLLAALASALGLEGNDWLYSRSVFFFLSGAWLMQYGSGFFLQEAKHRRAWLALAGAEIALMFVNERFPALDTVLNLTVPFCVWLGLPAMPRLACRPFCGDSFLIYCMHPIVVSFWRRLLAMLGPEGGQAWIILSYFLIIVLSTASLDIACGILRRMPGLRSLLNGGRTLRKTGSAEPES